MKIDSADTIKAEKLIKENIVYEGKILKLKSDIVLLPDKNKTLREIVVHNGGCAVLVEQDDKILFVKQFRYALNKEIYEIPAGKINQGETPDETARRELEEECGYVAKNIKLLFKTYASPGYSTEIIYIYKAENLIKTKTKLDKDEFLSSLWIDKEKVNQMINNDEICDAKTLIALLTVKGIKRG